MASAVYFAKCGDQMSIKLSETLELTRDLVAQNTIYPPGNEEKAAAVVAAKLREAGIGSIVYEILPHRTNLVARLKGTGEKPGLAFSAHFDTIDVDLQKWSVDPFAGEMRDGRLYGRGTADMKGGMAAMTMAMIAIARSGKPLKGDLVLTFSAAENSDCLGAKRLVADGHLDGIGALLISEPSGNRPLVTEKGALWLRVTATGDYTHNAFTEDRTGDRGNAIIRLARYLDKAHDLKLDVPEHRHVKPPTINVGVIRGGHEAAFVPSSASADIDIRLAPGPSAEAVLAEFQAIAGPYISLEILDYKPAVDTADDHPFVELCVGAYREETGSDLGPGGVGYYTDGAIMCPALGLPMVIIGPGEIGMSGAIDEYVDIEKLETSALIFERIARAYLG
ncbi:M20/M25/M40 family metallo-hydrolase [Pseudomonas yamanorum]|nr:M20/M25/M40 family metallo-hydrolase [Pseudomonas yamanorum]